MAIDSLRLAFPFGGFCQRNREKEEWENEKKLTIVAVR